MRAHVFRLKSLFNWLFSAALLHSCSDRITADLNPELSFEIIQAASDTSINIRYEAFNPYSAQLEYGLMITLLDSMNDTSVYLPNLRGIQQFIGQDLYFITGNPLLKNTRIKRIGTIRPSETVRLNEFTLDSLNRNSGYIIRAYMKGSQTLIYSGSRSIRSLEKEVMKYIVTLTLPFAPANFITINDKVYMLGDKLNGNSGLISYSPGADNYQTLASIPLNSTQYPLSSFSVKDGIGKIQYFVQEDINDSVRKYKRASYDPSANAWLVEGNACTSAGDTVRLENSWAHILKGRLITSQTYNVSQYRLTNSTITDYCPFNSSQQLIVACSPDKLTLNVSNTIFNNDTVLVSDQSGNGLSYFYSPIANAFLCGQIPIDSEKFNSKRMFVKNGRIYSIVYTNNPVSGKKELMVYRLTFPNGNSFFERAYNLSNSSMVQKEPLKNGVVRHFFGMGPTGYVFLQDGDDPKRFHIYSFTE